MTILRFNDETAKLTNIEWRKVCELRAFNEADIELLQLLANLIAQLISKTLSREKLRLLFNQGNF